MYMYMYMYVHTGNQDGLVVLSSPSTCVTRVRIPPVPTRGLSFQSQLPGFLIILVWGFPPTSKTENVFIVFSSQ